jgi:hypothetical protein
MAESEREEEIRSPSESDAAGGDASRWPQSSSRDDRQHVPDKRVMPHLM